MTTLSEQFNNHVLSQTINNKLNEIEKIVQNTSLNDQQKESAIAYQLLLQMVLTTLKTKSLPIIPKSIAGSFILKPLTTFKYTSCSPKVNV